MVAGRVDEIRFTYHCPKCGRSYRLIARITVSAGTQSLNVYDGEYDRRRLWSRCPACKKRFPKRTPEELKDALGAAN